MAAALAGERPFISVTLRVLRTRRLMALRRSPPICRAAQLVTSRGPCDWMQRPGGYRALPRE